MDSKFVESGTLPVFEEAAAQDWVREVLKSDEPLEYLLECLSDSRRKIRQTAAVILHHIASSHPQKLQGKEAILIDALYRPEAQTRWEILAILTTFHLTDDELFVQAQEAALDGLYDEDSNLVRLASFKYLLSLSQENDERLELIWPYIDEALQCYHGDSLYRDMLVELRNFVQCTLSEHIKTALIKRLSFDAEQAKGYLKAMSQALIEQLSHS